MPWDVRTRAELLLRAYCDRRVPEHARHQVRLEYELRGPAATIVERRVPWRPVRPDEPWTRSPVARFRFDPDHRRWSLEWRDRNGRWHPYDIEPAADLGDLLAELDRDPTGIFWG
jgi:hypothetical protein